MRIDDGLEFLRDEAPEPVEFKFDSFELVLEFSGSAASTYDEVEDAEDIALGVEGGVENVSKSLSKSSASSESARLFCAELLLRVWRERRTC